MTFHVFQRATNELVSEAEAEAPQSENKATFSSFKRQVNLVSSSLRNQQNKSTSSKDK